MALTRTNVAPADLGAFSTTTDDTPTVLDCLLLQPNTAYWVEYRIIAAQTSGENPAAGTFWRQMLVVIGTNGTASDSTVQVVVPDINESSLAIELSLNEAPAGSGAVLALYVTVTGLAATTIKWLFVGNVVANPVTGPISFMLPP